MWKKILVISLVFVLSLVILTGLSLYSFQRFNAYTQYDEAIEHHHVLLTQLNKLKYELIEIENNQRAFLLFDDSAFHLNFLKHIDSVKTTFKKVNDLTKQSVSQQKKLHSLNINIRTRLDYLQSALSIGYPGTDYKTGSSVMAKCNALIEEMEIHERDLLNKSYITKEFYENNTPQNFRILFIFTLIIFTISFGLLLQQYLGRISYQQALEKKIIELNQANEEWEQLSYIASHDLQEPLRKIRTFSDILQVKHQTILDEECKTIIKRIDVSSTRAQSLMQDIVNYNSIVHTKEELESVSLQDLLSNLYFELEQELLQKNAIIKTEHLPTIKAYPTQLKLLFKSLVENSLKFAKPDVPCFISIVGSLISKDDLPEKNNLSYTQYQMIEVSANGIGFDNEFTNKIFKIFQRLHTQSSQYEGRGLGLAIVKRIMTNHLGLVFAEGQTGVGAKFTLYFPVR